MDEPVHIFESKTDLDNIQLVPPVASGAVQDEHAADQAAYQAPDQNEEHDDDYDEDDSTDDFVTARERMRLIVKLDRIKFYFHDCPFIVNLIPEFDVLYKLPISRLRLMVEEALASVSARSSENAVKGFIAAGASALEALVSLVGLDASGLTNAVTHPDNKGMQDLIKEACIKYDSLTSTPVELRIALEIMRTIKELDRYNKERRGRVTDGRTGGNREQEVVDEETLEKAKDL